MNHWAQMLAAAPRQLHRLIARTQRVSLPRGSDAATQVERLRRALCRAATVRTTYQSLDPATQAAVQELRALRGGLAPADLAGRFGAHRSWSQMIADPTPRTTSERLLLLGWLLPRPAAPHHPPRFLLPPELRRWLPRPLAIPTPGPAAITTPPPALRCVATLLVLCAETPLGVRADGGLRRDALRRLHERLAPASSDEVAAMARDLLPLLIAQGLLACHAGECTVAPAAASFLALPPAAQLERLRATWLNAPSPDAWLTPLVVREHGMDWPVFRRRLVAWADALPVDRRMDAAHLYPLLAAAFGPLANAHTHGFRPVARQPWQPRRATAVWNAALRGPLAWLGYVGWLDDAHCVRPGSLATGDEDAPCWQSPSVGVLRVPHRRLDAAVMRLHHWATWHASDAHATTYTISRTAVCRAVQEGHSVGELRALLAQHLPALDPAWDAVFAEGSPNVRVLTTSIVITDQPAVLHQAMRARSVRRHVAERPAPGVALVAPDRVPALLGALARHHIQASVPPDVGETPRTDADAFAPGTCAALLVASAFFRRFAPPDAPLPPDDHIERHLHARLTPPLRDATAAAIARLGAPDGWTPGTSLREPSAPSVERLIRAAIAFDRMLTIVYDGGGHDARSMSRVVRPIALFQQDDLWYMRAFCTTRRAERTFRLDRMRQCRLHDEPRQPMHAA